VTTQRPAQPGDVFQINEKHGRDGWVGALVMAEEIKSFGIQGFVHVVKNHNEYGRAYIRLNWEEIDFVGHAPLVPQDVLKEADHATQEGGATDGQRSG
jgi:hypothetical protein